ncbi:MAG: glycosyltransferase, partial [Planctomycetota bacterium]
MRRRAELDPRPLRVVYFGTYSMSEGYPRNRVLVEGLRRAGVEVVTCHEDFWRDAAHKIAGAAGAGRLGQALAYGAAWLRLAFRYLRVGPHDVVVVGYTGQIDVFLARALNLFSRRPVVLDAFLSLHDTLVRDRGLVREGGAFARLLAWVDRTSCRLADLVLLDTLAHVRHFVARTGLPHRRFARLFVGEDDRVFRPGAVEPRRDGTPLRVLWFGTYVPLQGVDVVLDAAKRLEAEPVRFRMVGRGQQLEEFKARATGLANVELVPRWVGYDELVREIREADVCLGIFGRTAKAARVIPCKVYDSLAVGKPVVTAGTRGAHELLEDGRTALLIPPGDPEALAAALKKL